MIPWKSQPFREVIDESIERCRHREQKSGHKTRRCRPIPIFLDVKPTIIFHVLPADIQWLIVDQLEYRDIPRILRAFGWVLSDWYWSQRFPKDLIFEVEDLKKTDKVAFDWPFLCLGVEKLLWRSPGLLNRQRLLPVLRKTKKLFLEKVAKQHGTAGTPQDDQNLWHFYLFSHSFDLLHMVAIMTDDERN